MEEVGVSAGLFPRSCWNHCVHGVSFGEVASCLAGRLLW
jgi:hypothetical protein